METFTPYASTRAKFLDPSLGLILVMISQERFKGISSDLAQTSTFLSVVDDALNRIIPKCLTG